MADSAAQDSIQRGGFRREFRVLWAAQAVSELGTAVGGFALPLVAYVTAGRSALGASVVAASGAVAPVLAALPAGAAADRYNRRTIMLLVNLVCAIGSATAFLLGERDLLCLWMLIVLAALLSCGATFYRPAETAAVRRLVPDFYLPRAISQNQARRHAAGLCGGPIGGLLFTAGIYIPFGVDAASYVAAGLLVLLIRSRLSAGQVDRSRRTSVLEGLLIVRRSPFLRVFLSWAALANLVTPAFFLVLNLRLYQGGITPAVIGVVDAVAGTSGIAGALVAPWIMHRVPSGPLVIFCSVIFAVALLPITLTINPLVVCAAVALGVGTDPVVNSAIGSYRAFITPDAVQGRVSSATNLVASSAAPLGPVLGGALMTLGGGQFATGLLTALFLALALLLAASKTVREIPLPERWGDSAQLHVQQMSASRRQ